MTINRLNVDGYIEWSPGQMIAWILVVDGPQYEWFYLPNEVDIERIEATFDIEEGFITGVIAKKDPETHGILIDMPKYREGRRKEMADKLPIRIEPMLGEVSQHAQMLVDIATVTGRVVKEEFNGTDLVANPGESANSVYEEWCFKARKKRVHPELERFQ